MKKVLLAVGYKKLEDFLESRLNKDFDFIGTVVYREGIIKSIKQKVPDIVVIRETLNGNKNIMSIVYDIRANFPNIRIVFIAGNREPGDELLANLVNYGIYDILYGPNIQAEEIISLIKEKNDYRAVKHLQPVPVLDENRNKVLFKAPVVQEKIIKNKEQKENNSKNKQIEKNKENKKTEEIKKKIKKNEEIKEVKKPEEKNKNIDEEKKITNEDKNAKKENLFKGFKFPVSLGNNEKDNEKKDKKENKELPSKTPQIANERIITFVGGKSGVGTTSIAVNTAFTLAKKGYKVVYIELNEKYPSVSYWYELGLINKGIDTCIESISKNKYEEIKESIIKTAEIRKKRTAMRRNYKKFPKTLDFMFFSKKYLAGFKEKTQFSNFKELYLYLMYQMDYDYVIIDISCDSNMEALQSTLIYSNKIFSVVTQDISSIGYYLFNLDKLKKRGFDLSSKNYFIINNYEKAMFKKEDIKKWLNSEKVLTIPICNKDFIEANFRGLPVVLYSKNLILLESINEVTKNIMKK